jgi:RES domain-containing protein
VTGFSGIIWRAAIEGRSPLIPAAAPEGRFHHSGQPALYASLTPEGCRVAIRRYLRADDPPRLIHPLRFGAERVIDMSGKPDLSIVWQDWRDGGPSPTWAVSDRLRRQGWQAMLYSSRSRPDLTHIVIFNLISSRIEEAGAAHAF